jgi:hypothetical protein
MTGEPKGFVTADGATKGTDPMTEQKVHDAFATDLLVRDDQVLEELGGVCFDGVCSIGPADPAHNRMVLQNLGALTGLRPERTDEDESSSDISGT